MHPLTPMDEQKVIAKDLRLIMMLSDSRYDSSINLSRKDTREISPKIAPKPAQAILNDAAIAITGIKLSREELREISVAISRDFSPVFSAKKITGRFSGIKFSPRELREISESISLAYRPIANDTPELMLLPVDPWHMYAYWNLAETKADIPHANQAKQQLALRIYAHTADSAVDSQHPPSWFDVDIQTPKHQQKITLPEHADVTAYSAMIGKRYPDNSFVATSYSNRINIPLQGMVIYQPTGNNLEPPASGASPVKRINASGQR